MAELKRFYQREKDHFTFLFEDETDLLLFPPLRSAWAKVARPNRVWLSGLNAKKVIFGAINLKTGQHIEMERPKQRAEDFCAFLLELKRRHRKKPLAIFLDKDRSHDAMKSRVLAEKLGIKLLWLPTRSPEMNPMESLWGYVKPRVCANRQYRDIRDEVRKFLRFLRNFPNRRTLIVAGLHSKNFWLFN